MVVHFLKHAQHLQLSFFAWKPQVAVYGGGSARVGALPIWCNESYPSQGTSFSYPWEEGLRKASVSWKSSASRRFPRKESPPQTAGGKYHTLLSDHFHTALTTAPYCFYIKLHQSPRCVFESNAVACFIRCRCQQIKKHGHGEKRLASKRI